MWENITVFWLVLFGPDVSAFLWREAGNPIWLTYILLLLATLPLTAVVYFGTDWISSKLPTQWKIVKIISRVKEKLPLHKEIQQKNQEIQTNIIKWLKYQRAIIAIIVIFLMSCIPLLPPLTTAATIAAKLLEIKHGLIVVFSATAVRGAVLVIIIYYFPSVSMIFS